jgi:hypothetical protein
MENKEEYFIPEIEDIYVGYECELQDEKNWNHFKFYRKYDFEIDLERRIFNQTIRVLYLTKKQIEAEGWISQSETGFFTKDKYELYYNQQWNNDKEFSLQILDQPNFLYQGECKDINTFRKLIKLLSIE